MSVGEHELQGPRECQWVLESLPGDEFVESSLVERQPTSFAMKVGGSVVFKLARLILSLRSCRSQRRRSTSASPTTAGTALSDSLNVNTLATLRHCTLSLSHMESGGGDCPTLALPTGARPRKPRTFEMLFLSVVLVPRLTE